MVTTQVNNLIDFVAEVFAHSESSSEEAKRIASYLTTANLTGPGVPLPDDTWAAIVATAREVGTGETSIQRAVS